MKREKNKIVFVDDHALILKGLHDLFQDSEIVQIEGLFATGEALDQYLEMQVPDIVVMDIQMPGQNGLDRCRDLRRRFPQIKLILLTMLDQLEFFKQAIQLGCEGYLLKSGSPEEILLAVSEIIQGKKYYSHELAQKYFTEPSFQGLQNLTAREVEIIKWLANGKSNKEIAYMLFISIRTVEFHRANIFEKLKITSIAELVKYALRNNMIDLDPKE